MDVQLRETTVEIPTHRLLAPSVNPALFGKNFHPFPYSMQNHVEDAPTPVKWRAIELENEYLKLVVLPDLGGRIAELYDKLAGKHLLTPMRIIKPRMIAHRGAWVAGGLEFNFPISHSPTTTDSVSCMTQIYPDGSASVIFGAIERLTFMNWKVELRLYPDKAYLEQSVELINPTDNYHRFYFWSNAAVPYIRGMRMAYPFDWRTTMDRGYDKWPMDGAADCTDPGSIPGSYETFGKLMMQDYFGVHYPEWDFGVAHTAERKHVKGAKFFMWGNNEQADAWNRALLDKGEEYIEIQSGVFESQGVFKHLAPSARLEWKEYWFGVRGIGQYSQASRDVAVTLERIPGGVVLRLSANGKFENCTARLTHNGAVQERIISLSPESLSAVEYMGVADGDPLTVDVFCQGRLLISIGHGAGFMEDAPDADLFEDSRIFRPAGENDDKPLARGLHHEQWGRLAEAVEAYEENLCMNPDCTVTLTRLGRIKLAQRLPTEAIDYFERALRYDNRCGTARFGLACAWNSAGDAEMARRLFYDIAADDPLFEASMLEAAALNIRLGDPWANITMLEGCQNPRGLFLYNLSCRAAGLSAGPEQDSDTLVEFGLAERFLGLGDSKALSSFTGNDEGQLVCIALEYARLGLTDDCLSILGLIDKPGMKTALARALCGHQSLTDALELPIDGVFINEPMLLDMLESANDSTGKAMWLLGGFKYSVGLRAEALDCWLASYESGFRHTALLYSLGQAYYLEGDIDEACKYLKEDASLHQSANAESLALLFRVLKERGDIFERLEMMPLLQEAANQPMVVSEIVEALRDGGLLEDALAVLETASFQNWEGGETSGLLWSSVIGALAMKHAGDGRTCMARTIAARIFDYPEGLYYGRRPGQSQAESYHTLGLVYRLTGDYEKSYEAFKQGAGEGGNAAIRANAEAMRWVRLCQNEMRAYRHID